MGPKATADSHDEKRPEAVGLHDIAPEDMQTFLDVDPSPDAPPPVPRSGPHNID